MKCSYSFIIINIIHIIIINNVYLYYVISLCVNFSEKIIYDKNDNISDINLLFNTRDKNAYIFLYLG